MDNSTKPITTVAMTRCEPAHEGGPNLADVHPDEVAQWKAAGWEFADREGIATEHHDEDPGTGGQTGAADAPTNTPVRKAKQ